MKSLEERMKSNYEKRQQAKLLRRVPVIIRVDGQAFHTYTRSMEPFDEYLIQTMVHSAYHTMQNMASCKACYVQSDEASFLLTDYDTFATEAWFDYKQQKLDSITASLFTAFFNSKLQTGRLATFDARSFNVPREEVVNYFLWRAQDCERNSLQMYCQQFFSHKELHNKNMQNQHEMLHSIEKNWVTDLNSQKRNGTLIVDGECVHPKPRHDELSKLLGKFL